MRNSLNHKWLYLVNTLPIMLYLSFRAGKYFFTSTPLFLSERCLFPILLVIGTFTFIFAWRESKAQKVISIHYAWVTFVLYLVLILGYYFINQNFVSLLSSKIWTSPFQIVDNLGTFLMPNLLLSITVIILQSTGAAEEKSVWKSFRYVVFIPVAIFFSYICLLPLWQKISFFEYFGTSLSVLTVIIAVVLVFAFFYFLIQSAYIYASKKSDNNKHNSLIFNSLLFFFSFLGLVLNQKNYWGIENIWGDFSSPYCYLLFALNGIFFMLKTPSQPKWHLVLFLLRCMSFIFMVYFFMVFLPLFPLSIALILVIGLGLLMMLPLLQFVLQGKKLWDDFQILKAYFSKKMLVFSGILSFLFIPFLFIMTCIYDKKVIQTTFEYLYEPDYSKDYFLDNKQIQRSLYFLTHNINNIGFQNDNSTTIPIITPLYNYLVLDNLSISDKKLNFCNMVFNGKSINPVSKIAIENSKKFTTTYKSSTYYDEKQGTWFTWVDFELTSINHFGMFMTDFELPEGCFISDYYLYVNEKKEMGMLTEKKAANWIFDRIRNQRRDPGLLTLNNQHNVSFKVFPFSNNETRKTGIQFMHKTPLYINFEGQKILLGLENQPFTLKNTTSYDNNISYISAEEKANLKAVTREPYAHFIIDISKGKAIYKEDYKAIIDKFTNQNPNLLKNAKITFCNSLSSSSDFTSDWENKLASKEFDGGFFLVRAIKKGFLENYESHKATYPIFVVVSNAIDQAIMDESLDDFRSLFPENEFFYALEKEGIYRKYSLINYNSTEFEAIEKPLTEQKVLAFPNEQNPVAYLRNDNQPSIVIKEAVFNDDQNTLKKHDFQSALSLFGNDVHKNLYPQKAHNQWLRQVKLSFYTKILNLHSSFIVVETETQKQELLRKQEEVLAGNPNLDVSDGEMRMSEPSDWAVMFLLLLFLAYRRWKGL